jgi:RNA polymerase sigma-70 factor, ECF subfamily
LDVDVEHFYRKYGPMVFRRCRRMLGNETLAEDAMQDTFVLLLRNKKRLKGDAASSLLYTIATNVCLNIIRSSKRRPEVGDDDLLSRIAGADSVESRLVARNLLDRVFSQELPSTGTIAVLHLLDGMTLEEVATEVGMSVSGVRKRLRSLRKNVSELQGVA